MCSGVTMTDFEEIDPGTPMAKLSTADSVVGPGPDCEMGGDSAYS